MSTTAAVMVIREERAVAAVPTTAAPPRQRGARRLVVAGATILGLLVVMALLAPVFGSPYHLYANGLDSLGSPLGVFAPHHLLGTDTLGRDLLTRTAYGLRSTLIIAFVANITSVGLGTLVGLIAGFYRGWTEQLLMRIVDVFLSIPTVLSGLALASIVGQGVAGIVVVVTALYWAWTARLVHGEVVRLRNRGFVEAALAHGVSRITVLRRHVLPHISAILLNISALNGAAVIVVGSGLSYLGAGVQPPAPELGNMLEEGSASIDYAPHLLIVPLVPLVLAVMSFVLIAEGINRLNPLSERRSWLDI